MIRNFFKKVAKFGNSVSYIDARAKEENSAHWANGSVSQLDRDMRMFSYVNHCDGSLIVTNRLISVCCPSNGYLLYAKNSVFNIS